MSANEESGKKFNTFIKIVWYHSESNSTILNWYKIYFVDVNFI